ncbi:hypothetical protein HPP92_020773 [Vanilla planifolia]|uniref:Uncharacterized protein n=1 Tax=Vanilla planifolia TaxID=51239 RepID=A0A835PU81_VANPL|nr:hypothetical protein HPP92_020773 [Vanilla planifolia]
MVWRSLQMLLSFGAPEVAKDGVTVAKSIEFKDSVKNMGATIVKQLLIAKIDVAGDAPGRSFNFHTLEELFKHQCQGESLGLCAIKASGFGDNKKVGLLDLAILTGGDDDLVDFYAVIKCLNNKLSFLLLVHY